MGNIGSVSHLVPCEFYHSAPLGDSNVALGSGNNCVDSKYLLSSLGMPSGVATPLALAHKALDVGYVE